MKPGTTLFEVSWEVCNKVGGLHTVVVSKAPTLVERLGDGYVLVGPWLLGEGNADRVLERDAAFDPFAEECRALGVPVRVGRWRTHGRPRTVLVEFSGLLPRKDELLGALWDRHGVDSLYGQWEYVEPVLFGHAAGMVVEHWWRQFVAGRAGGTVVQFHEWLSGSGLLYLRERLPAVGTVSTTHATVLGRALASTGTHPKEALGARAPEQAAAELNVRARHSLEGTVVRAADVFTTVSPLTADEAALFHSRTADRILPNGIDFGVLDAELGGVSRRQAEERLRFVASRFLAEDLAGAAVLCSAGRYEFRNKGLDLLIDALGEVNRRPGRQVVAYLFVPAGNSGVLHELAERLATPLLSDASPLGISTHTLFDAEHDAIAQCCAAAGLTNARGSRVKIVHVPVYVTAADPVMGLSYEAAAQGADLAVFPSFYEAWGYTPQETLALGVPTVTTDCAGFGLWARERGLGPADGVHVLRRSGRTFDEARGDLAALVDGVASVPPSADLRERCRDAVRTTEWSGLVGEYEKAFDAAREVASARLASSAPAAPPVARPLLVRAPAQAVRPHLHALVVPSTLPRELEPLVRLSRNWRWTWDLATLSLFRDLSPETWERCRGNPVRLLREAPPDALAARARDEDFRERASGAAARLDNYLADRPRSATGLSREHPVAYFSAEFGLHECLPIYSGGLGVLAGDHVRSASDLRLPLVAVGILYRRGYMRQRLEAGVQQVALDDELDPRQHALSLVADGEGRPIEVVLQLPGTTVVLRAWRADVGRVPLYLLDADLDANRPEDRGITHHLYGGDLEMRIRQELVLGRGGMRLLERIGIEPSVVHMNEGHAAFVALERMAALVRDRGLTFEEARELVRSTTVFTTHTPVPAGHDHFDEDLLRRYFSDVETWLGIPWARFVELGVSLEAPDRFNMTALALRFASFVNGVSRRHGEVSRHLAAAFVPQLLPEEMPIQSVTNGVHLAAWTSGAIAGLLARDAGAAVTGEDFARGAERLDDRALWEARQRARRTLLHRVADHVRSTFELRGDSPALCERIVAGLDEDALLVGFARRFATYKRADLLLREPARLRALLSASKGPVRLLVAGKAHPRDMAARELLARVAAVARTPEFAGRLILLEDYDMGLARTLVQGVDVWLNTPRAPLEASGTSGMKAAANGALNVSIADGWWPEAFDGANGWTIGGAGPARSDAVQDELDAESLHHLLEDEIVPLWFDRDADGIPREWLRRVRHSLATIPPVFDTHRMVSEYRERAYVPLAARRRELVADGHLALRAATAETERVRRGMQAVRIVEATLVGAEVVEAGDPLGVHAAVDLGPLRDEDVQVEFVATRRAADPAAAPGELVAVELTREPRESHEPAGAPRRFRGSWIVPAPGAWSYGLRVRPRRPGGPSLHDPVVWA